MILLADNEFKIMSLLAAGIKQSDPVVLKLSDLILLGRSFL